MRILIAGENRNYTILLPITMIILNRFTAKLISKFLSKYADVRFTDEQFYSIFKELRRAKKTFSKLTLVDIETATGKKVKIML